MDRCKKRKATANKEAVRVLAKSLFEACKKNILGSAAPKSAPHDSEAKPPREAAGSRGAACRGQEAAEPSRVRPFGKPPSGKARKSAQGAWFWGRGMRRAGLAWCR